MANRVLIAGVSTRAAAESAATAGFDVAAIDAYGDLDQHPSVRSLSLPRDFGARFSAQAAARVARKIECDAVAYLSPFENHPRAVAALAAGRQLWGNPPDVLRRVRDPLLVSSALRRRGFPTPVVRVNEPNPPSPDGFGEASVSAWITKPLRSGGGQRVRRWRQGIHIPRGGYLQEFIDGISASVVFVAAGGRAVALGVSRQLIGEAAFGASGHRYCGNVLLPEGDAELDAVVGAACELARAVVEEFNLVGVNGIDFVARDEVPYAIEVNPRWSSSMELIERAYGVSVFGAHAAACVDGALPAFDLARARRDRRVAGKAVVFARENLVAPDTQAWLRDPMVRDVPKAGEIIRRGQPVCTVFASGVNAAGCYDALVQRAGELHDHLAASRIQTNA